MSVPQIIFGIAVIGLGLIFTKIQIKAYRGGVKDTFGSEIRMLITGIGLIIIGIVIIIKAFTE